MMDWKVLQRPRPLWLRVLSLGLIVPALLLLAACSKQQTLRALFQACTPHDDYARRLRQAGLDQRPAGRAWLAAADRAMRDSLVVALPFTETGYFQPDRPTAAGYRFAVQAGEQVRVRLELAPGATARVFVDAFEVGPGRAPAPLASADTAALDFRYRADATGQHLLRVQPELLAAGRYTLRLTHEPSLGTFPVRGRADAAIGSFWGVARDGGARRHEGIDIFAPRGTPAVAAVAGTVTRLDNTRLGGTWYGWPPMAPTSISITPTLTASWWRPANACAPATPWVWWATPATPAPPRRTCTLAFTAPGAAPSTRCLSSATRFRPPRCPPAPTCAVSGCACALPGPSKPELVRK